eukprot:g16426.t1
MRIDEAFSATPDTAAKPVVKVTEIPPTTTSATTSTPSAAPAPAAAPPEDAEALLKTGKLACMRLLDQKPPTQPRSEDEIRAAVKEAVLTHRFSLIGCGAPTPDLGAEDLPEPTDEPPGAPGLDSTSTTSTTAESSFDPDDFDLLGASFDTPVEVATPPGSPLPEVKPDEKAIAFCTTTGRVHLPRKGFSVAGDFYTPPDLSIGGVHLFSADRIASAIEGFRPPMSTSHFLMLDSKEALGRARKLNEFDRFVMDWWIAKEVADGKLEKFDASKHQPPLFLSPVQLAPRKGSALQRIVIDYRVSKKHLKPYGYKPADADNILQSLARKKCYMLADMALAYNLAKLSPFTQSLLAVVCPSGTYLPTRLTLGPSVAPSYFQSRVDAHFGQIDGLCPYLDDLSAGFDTFDELLQCLNAVGDVCREHGFRLSLRKATICASKCDALGYTVSASGLQMQESKVKVLKNWPYPREREQLESFLCLGRVKDLAQILITDPATADRMIESRKKVLCAQFPHLHVEESDDEENDCSPPVREPFGSVAPFDGPANFPTDTASATLDEEVSATNAALLQAEASAAPHVQPLPNAKRIHKNNEIFRISPILGANATSATAAGADSTRSSSPPRVKSGTFYFLTKNDEGRTQLQDPVTFDTGTRTDDRLKFDRDWQLYSVNSRRAMYPLLAAMVGARATQKSADLLGAQERDPDRGLFLVAARRRLLGASPVKPGLPEVEKRKLADHLNEYRIGESGLLLRWVKDRAVPAGWCVPIPKNATATVPLRGASGAPAGESVTAAEGALAAASDSSSATCTIPLRRALVQEARLESGHGGAAATFNTLMQMSAYWPGIFKDARGYRCVLCEAQKKIGYENHANVNRAELLAREKNIAAHENGPAVT